MPSEFNFHPLGASIAHYKDLDRAADIDPRLTRSHYFDGRLLTAEDLNRDQLYVDSRLREVGLSLGQGVLKGLDLDLDNSRLSLQPGLAISGAGRVLEVSKALTIDLGDRALLGKLNQGHFRRLNRGLYAVVLKYAEVAGDIAEVFPRDLAARREIQYDVISEGVQLGIVLLPQPLPEQSAVHTRARLIVEMLADGHASGAIPEDSVALGVLAISGDRPQWLDSQLLRQPLGDPAAASFQQRLARHYESLFADVMTQRRSASLNGHFTAAEYFRLLPPAGSLPKDAIDPVAGRQGFFPEACRVWVAPLRRSDLELVRAEAMTLSAIDLALEEAADIVVLAPLANSDYGNLAARLERDFNADNRRLPVADLLRLRLYPQRRVHQLDTDAATWQAIWDAVGESELLYVRRPLRVAETGISAMVLARGSSLPAAPAEPSTPVDSPADGRNLIEDEDSVFLRRLNFRLLAAQRPPVNAEGQKALAELQAEFGDQAEVVQQAMNLLLRIGPRYDALSWQTLFALVRAEALDRFLVAFAKRRAKEDASTPELVVELGRELGLDGVLLKQWANLKVGLKKVNLK